MSDSGRHAGHELQPHYKPAVSAAPDEGGRSRREIERSHDSSDNTARSAAQMAVERGRSLNSSDRTEAPFQALRSTGTEAPPQPRASAMLQSSLVFRSPTDERALAPDSERKAREGQALSAKEVKEIFEILDRNEDGQISMIEFIKGLRADAALAMRLGLPSKIAQEDKSRDIFQHTYGDMDVDLSKSISFDEFSSYYLRQRPSSTSTFSTSHYTAAATANATTLPRGLQGHAEKHQSPVDAPQDARKKASVTQQDGDRPHGARSATRDNVPNRTVNTHSPSTKVPPNLVRSANSDMAGVMGTTSPTSSVDSSIKDQQRSFSIFSPL